MIETVNTIASSLDALSAWTQLAQVSLEDIVEEGVSKLSILTVLISVAGISIGGFMIIRGQIEFALYIILGALVIGAAYPIATSFAELGK